MVRSPNFRSKHWEPRIPAKPMNLIETLARMWIECDPNRGGEKGSGFHADDFGEDGKPRWHWFIPRAEETIKFLKAKGYKITNA